MLRDPVPHLGALDRSRGALLGLAAGDALGAAVEFQPPGSFPPVTGMRAGGVHHLEAGEWTDDTSMALCLAESLVTCGRFDARDQMERYLRWYRQGHLASNGKCFDIGTTTREALERYERTGEPFAGSPDPRRAGNGSLMRLAPVVIWHAGVPALAIEQAAASSRTTHAAPAAVDACRYFAGLLCGALAGLPKEVFLEPDWCPEDGLWVIEPLDRAVAGVAAGSFRHRAPPKVRAGGYVVDALEAALWAFHATDDFTTGALAVVNLGEDSDTVGAIYGQLAGAYYGTAAIPPEWRMRLAKRALIEEFAERLVHERPREWG
jgi:ADP-ribosyl-[dinitrogen reductase] hydrolase